MKGKIMSENNKSPMVEIIIRGDVGAGKTTICWMIEKALKAESITNVKVTDEECVLKPETYSRRIEALKQKNVDIRINVDQMSRSELIEVRERESQ